MLSRTNKDVKLKGQDAKDAKLACFFGLAVRRDIHGTDLFRRGHQFRSRTQGREVTDDGRGDRTWVEITEAGNKYTLQAAADKRRQELSDILTKDVLFYAEIGEWEDASNRGATTLRTVLAKDAYAPWLDIDQVTRRIKWKIMLKTTSSP